MIVAELTGPQFFYCSDVDAPAREIIECFADRAAIEQVFHDVKEVWGSGQRQVRNLWANIAAWHVNMALQPWWNCGPGTAPAAERCIGRTRPGTAPDRRPSHADRRKPCRRPA
ncbi:MAG: transposase [Planctomycetaceae bacterium]